jgi:hypothetical protein
MVRKNTGMKHVRIGNHDMARLSYRFSSRLGRIAVVGVGFHVHAHFRDHIVKLQHLVLGQSLGGKQKQGSGIGIL